MSCVYEFISSRRLCIACVCVFLYLVQTWARYTIVKFTWKYKVLLGDMRTQALLSQDSKKFVLSEPLEWSHAQKGICV